MNRTWNRFIFLFAIAASLVVWLLAAELVREKKKNQRIIHSSENLHRELTQMRTQSNGLMAQNEVLRLSNSELQILLPGLRQEIENLKIKNHRAKQIALTTYKIDTLLTVQIRDSMVIDTIRDTLEVKIFQYDDSYLQLRAKMHEDIAQLQVNYVDTLIQVVYRGEREKPWLWIFSRRKLLQRVSLKNPNARIHYSRVIEIEN